MRFLYTYPFCCIHCILFPDDFSLIVANPEAVQFAVSLDGNYNVQ